MKLHSTLLAVSASLALAATGCLVGEVEPGTGTPGTGTPGTGTPGTGDGTPGDGSSGGVTPPETPEQAFQAVIPAIAASCGAGGAGCHSVAGTPPVFVTAGDQATVDLTAAYQKMKANKDSLYPNNAPTDKILTYGDGTAHSGGTFQYSAAHLLAVQAWLAAEAAQPIGEDQPSPLAIWSGCMDLQQFQNSGMADAWADKNAQGQGDCDACHNLGADGFIASNVDTRVFEALTTSPRLMISYFTLNEAGTEVIINDARLTKVGTQQDPHQLHGAFNLNGDAYQRLQNFYNQTKARVDDPNIQCQPPRFAQ